MPEEGIPLKEKESFMTHEEVISIAKEFTKLGVDKIRLTGGEPLVKKGADHIIRELGKLPVKVTLTTNGILADRFIETFKEAGVKDINISLDSLQEDRFNKISRRNYFSKIRENINLLIREEFNIKINVVLIKDVNDDEIIDFVRWSEQEPISVQFIEFMPFDGNNWNTEKTISEEEIIENITSFYGNESLQKLEDPINSTSRNYTIHGAKGSFGIISTVTNPFCDSCNRIRLTADGKIKTCLFSNEEVDLLSVHRSGDSIQELIHESILQKKQSRGGLGSFSNENIALHENRSMITIGG